MQRLVNELLERSAVKVACSVLRGGWQSDLPFLPDNRGHNGEVLGSEDFFQSVLKKFERRTKPSDQSKGTQRLDDYYFDPVEKVIWEFENIKGMRLEEIDIST